MTNLVERLHHEYGANHGAPLIAEAADAIEELCAALHRALEWPIDAEESDRLWEVLWKYGESPVP